MTSQYCFHRFMTLCLRPHRLSLPVSGQSWQFIIYLTPIMRSFIENFILDYDLSFKAIFSSFFFATFQKYEADISDFLINCSYSLQFICRLLFRSLFFSILFVGYDYDNYRLSLILILILPFSTVEELLISFLPLLNVNYLTANYFQVGVIQPLLLFFDQQVANFLVQKQSPFVWAIIRLGDVFYSSSASQCLIVSNREMIDFYFLGCSQGFVINRYRIFILLMARLCLCLPMIKLIQFYLLFGIIESIIIRMLRFVQSKTFGRWIQRQKFSTTRTVGNIDFIQSDSFLKVVLNRPKALNSLNLQMIRDLNANLESIGKNKAFWIEGAGGKAFCAGGDVKALFDKDAKVEDRLTFFREQFSLDYKISQLSALQIANWDGIVMGGGFGVSAFSPFIIATQNSMFAMPQAKLGFFTDVGSTYLLSRLRNNIGFYLGLSGSRLKGEDVYLSGLANYYFNRDSIQPAYEQIKQAIPKSNNPKETIHSILSKYHKQPKATKIGHQDQINEIFSAPTVQDLYKRVSTDSDKFCLAMTKALNQQCPVSLGIVHRLIHSAKNKTLRECFIQDYNLCQKSIVDPNFAEGVRTVLVDRGSEPNWSHKHVLQVTSQDVDKYFDWPSTFEKLNI